MFCAVYRLRSQGHKLEREVVQRHPSHGDLSSGSGCTIRGRAVAS